MPSNWRSERHAGRLLARARYSGHQRRRHPRADAPHRTRRRDARLLVAQGRRPFATTTSSSARATRLVSIGDANVVADVSTDEQRVVGDGRPARRRCSTAASRRTSSIAASARCRVSPSCRSTRRSPRSRPATRTACSSSPGPGDPENARAGRRRRSAASSTSGCRTSASASATSSWRWRSARRPASCKFGHRGGNHPVQDLRPAGSTITTQNHGFQVDAGSVPTGRRLARRTREPQRRLGRGPGATASCRSSRSSTTPRLARARRTTSTSSTASSTLIAATRQAPAGRRVHA